MLKRLALTMAVLALAAGGVLAAGVLAGTGPLATTASTSTDTTATATTATTAAPTTATTATTTATAPAKPKPQPKPVARLPLGVKVGGVHVGGLRPTVAYEAVHEAYASPLTLLVGKLRLEVSPSKLGVVAYVQNAVAKALHSSPGADLRVHVVVHADVTRAYVASLSQRFERQPVDARVFLRSLKPVLTPSVVGRHLDLKATVTTLVKALMAGRRTPLRLALTFIQPTVSDVNFGAVIVIHRNSNRLYLYKGSTLWRTLGVATGQAIYPTPLGHFSIVVKWENPWWYPPASPWAVGAKPIPPGPGNPLGTRWMGLSAPGVGIHGTPDSGSIGYSASHGCIRMLIPDAEWLFAHVDIGTQVFIVSA